MAKESREELARIRAEALEYVYDKPGPEEKRIINTIKSQETHEQEMRKNALRRKAQRGNLHGTN